MTLGHTEQAAPQKAAAEQRATYPTLLSYLGQASPEEIQQVLDEREPVKPEDRLTPEQMAELQSQISAKQLTMPTWAEFAWAVFLYGVVGGDKVYQNLMGKTDFLNALRTDSANVSCDELQTKLITGFLNPWRTRIPTKTAVPLKEQIESIQPFVVQLSQFEIGTVNFDQSLTVNSSRYTISRSVKECYNSIKSVGGIGSTATAKILHVLLPQLCVMWDTPILKRFTGRLGADGSGDEYADYLRAMRRVANGIITEFGNCKARLNPPAQAEETPESYLSERMKYPLHKTLAKFLDEYYWVKITNGVSLPPQWHPD